MDWFVLCSYEKTVEALLALKRYVCLFPHSFLVSKTYISLSLSLPSFHFPGFFSLLSTTRSLNISIIAYTPLSRGLLPLPRPPDFPKIISHKNLLWRGYLLRKGGGGTRRRCDSYTGDERVEMIGREFGGGGGGWGLS